MQRIFRSSTDFHRVLASSARSLIKWSFAFIPLMVFASACTQPSINLDNEMAALLRLQEQERKAHLEYNADLLISLFADDFTSIANGKMTQPSRAEMRKRFEAYFSRVHFITWENTEPPVITIANDASVAWILVQKRVILVPKDSLAATPDTTLFAWSAHYKKYPTTTSNNKSEWKLATIVSTNQTKP